jgi:hypothetical protein
MPLRPTPIFDTNVFGDVQRVQISQADWKILLRHRPRRGWGLSSVTALELLAALHAAPPDAFLDVRERIALAYDVCKGRVLEDPRFLICKEILHIPFPPDELPQFSCPVYLPIVTEGSFARNRNQSVRRNSSNDMIRAACADCRVLIETSGSPLTMTTLAGPLGACSQSSKALMKAGRCASQTDLGSISFLISGGSRLRVC